MQRDTNSGLPSSMGTMWQIVRVKKQLSNVNMHVHESIHFIGSDICFVWQQ